MGQDSNIQWTQATWNPWHGCKKVSEGCKFCYMYRDKERYGQDPTNVLRSKTNFNAPLKWQEGKLIFTCSWSDWFIDEADEWRDEAWKIIKATPQHTYQILTKRPERIKDHLPADWGNGYNNVWLGVSTENQKTADERIPELLKIKATVRFLSIEPLLGEIRLHNKYCLGCGRSNYSDNICDCPAGTGTCFRYDVPKDAKTNWGIDWVIIGGESGNETGKYLYRKCNIDWIRYLVKQCAEAEVPVFVKQLGTYLAKELKMSDTHGGNIDEFTKHLQIRQFPKTKKINQ